MHWCLLSIVGVAIFGLLLCCIIRKLTSNATVIAHVDEFIGSLGSSVFIMELGVISTQYGGYSLYLLIAGYVHVFLKLYYFSKTGGLMNPLSFIASYYKDGRQIRFSLFFAASIIITQLTALYAGQQLARFIWTLEDDIHVEAAHVACTTAMSPTHPWYVVAMSEAVGIIIVVFVDAITPSSLEVASGAFAIMTLYFFLTHISGSFFNPAIATAFSFHCKGHKSDWEHLVVYWIAPAVGMVIALELLDGFKNLARKKDFKKME